MKSNKFLNGYTVVGVVLRQARINFLKKRTAKVILQLGNGGLFRSHAAMALRLGRTYHTRC